MELSCGYKVFGIGKLKGKQPMVVVRFRVKTIQAIFFFCFTF